MYLHIFTLLGSLHAIHASYSIYGDAENFTLFTSKDFESHLYNSKYGWLIQFFNSWCGHCKAYAPEWRRFSARVYGWRYIFKVGAIDCSQEENKDICRNYEVFAFPQIKIYPPNMTEVEVKEKPKLGTEIDSGRRSMRDLMPVITSFIAKNMTHPFNFNKYEASTTDNLFDNLDDSKQFAVLLGTHCNTTAMDVILDLGFDPSISARCATFKEKAFYVTVKKRGGVERRIPLNGLENSRILTGIIRSLLSKLDHEILFVLNPNGQTKKTTTKKMKKITSSTTTPNPAIDQPVYMVDLIKSLSYTFRHEVSLHSEIAGEAFVALRNFLKVLTVYFPAPPKVHNYLKNVYDSLVKSDKNHLSYEEYVKILDDSTSDNAILPDQRSWKGCKGSSAQYRGYPCSLWTLFHTLTVGSYVRRKTERRNYDPIVVLKAIHGYVKYFFSCRYCSEHFQEMFALDAENRTKKAGDEVMWLWYGHNKVNKRLSGDISEDPMYKKIQFPPISVCPKCWKSDGTEMEENEVFIYLRQRYSNIVSVSEDYESNVSTSSGSSSYSVFPVSYEGVANAFGRKKVDFAKNFGYPDFPLCVMIYVITIVTMLIFYSMMISKRKCRLKNVHV